MPSAKLYVEQYLSCFVSKANWAVNVADRADESANNSYINFKLCIFFTSSIYTFKLPDMKELDGYKEKSHWVWF